MTKWLVSLACAALLGFCFAGDAQASGSGTASVGTTASWCFGLIGMGGSGSASGSGSGINGQNGLISPIVECFTDTAKGIIPTVTKAFINKTKNTYLATIGVMFLLAIAWFGMQIYTGAIKRLKSETIILGLKMAGIMLFIDNAATIYVDMVNILQDLSNTISAAAKSVHNNGFCTGTGTAAGSGGGSAWGATNNAQGLWQRWDCIFSYLLAFSSAGFAAASIASFLLLMFFSVSNGILVMVLGLYVISRLIIAALRFVHIYLMSVLSLSFMFCIGYIFVPLLLFKRTYSYFNKWLSMVIGFIVTPVIMFGFMGMMLVALDIALFSGQYSLFCAIGGSSACGSNATAGANLFSNMTKNVDVNGEFGAPNPALSDNFKNLFFVALDGLNSVNSGGSGFGSGGSSIPGSVNGPCNSPEWTGAGGYACSVKNSGSGGFGSGTETGSAYEAAPHPAEAQFGLQQTGLNLSNLASSAGSTCTLTTIGSSTFSFGSGGSGGSGTPESYYSNCPYVENILIALLVVALLIYIMISLLSYIPVLATSLTGDMLGGSDIGSSIQGQAMKAFGGFSGISSAIMNSGQKLASAADTTGGLSNMGGQGLAAGMNEVRASSSILAGKR